MPCHAMPCQVNALPASLATCRLPYPTCSSALPCLAPPPHVPRPTSPFPRLNFLATCRARPLSWCLQLHIASPSWDSSEKHIILCFPTGAVGQLTVAAHLLALIILIAFAWCSSGGVRKPLTPSDRASNQNHPTNAEQDAEAPLRM